MVRDAPAARAAYVIEDDLANLEPVLDDLLGPDTLSDERSATRIYYLGDFPADRYAEGFLGRARAVIDRTDAAAGRFRCADASTCRRSCRTVASVDPIMGSLLRRAVPDLVLALAGGLLVIMIGLVRGLDPGRRLDAGVARSSCRSVSACCRRS